MATAEEYARWLVANEDKKGTPEFDTVAEAYRVTRGQVATPEPEPGINYGRMAMEGLGGVVGGAVAVAAGNLGPQVLAPDEVVTVPLAVGAGSAIGGQAYDVLDELFTGRSDGRDTLLSEASQSTVDFIANATGARAGDELARIGAKVAREAAVGAKSSGKAIADAFEAMGIRPTAGALGKDWVAGAENALSKLPISSSMISREYQRVLEGMGSFARRTANRLSGASGKDAVGGVVRKGTKGFVNRFETQATKLYGAIPINKGDRVIPSAYLTELSKVSDEFADDAAYEFLTPGTIKQLSGAAEQSPTMTWGTLKALRSRLGKQIDSVALMGDAAQGDLKMLYGALSEDMARISADHSPQALQAFKRANTYWAAGRGRIDDVLNPMVKSAIEADIFNAVMRGAKDGPQRLRVLKSSLNPEEWNAVVAQTIRDMGRASSGAQDETLDVFSPAVFVTNYDKFHKSGAAKVLFEGKGYKGLGKAMDNLLKASASLKEASKFANTSNTASAAYYMSLLTGGGFLAGGTEGAGTAVAGGALSLLAPAAAAKLLTSPKFVNWLAKGTTTAMTQSGIGAHIGELAAIAATQDEAIADELTQYLEALTDLLQSGGPSNLPTER